MRAANGTDLPLSSQLILFMFFTSCLYSSRVPTSADNFLFLPRCTRICQFLGFSGVRAVTQAWSLTGSTGDPGR